MTILARYHKQIVEVADVFTTGDGRKLAEIISLDGERWPQYTHGGWCESSYKTVPVDQLQPADDCTCRPDWVTCCAACRLEVAVSLGGVS